MLDRSHSNETYARKLLPACLFSNRFRVQRSHDFEIRLNTNKSNVISKNSKSAFIDTNCYTTEYNKKFAGPQGQFLFFTFLS